MRAGQVALVLRINRIVADTPEVGIPPANFNREVAKTLLRRNEGTALLGHLFDLSGCLDDYRSRNALRKSLGISRRSLALRPPGQGRGRSGYCRPRKARASVRNAAGNTALPHYGEIASPSVTR